MKACERKSPVTEFICVIVSEKNFQLLCEIQQSISPLRSQDSEEAVR